MLSHQGNKGKDYSRSPPLVWVEDGALKAQLILL